MPPLIDSTRPRLVWLEPVPVIFAHDILSAKIRGNDVSILFYLKREMEGEAVVCPNLELIRPLDSCLRLTLREMLRQQMDAKMRDGLPLQ